MSKGFGNRIKTYIVMSIIALVVCNSLSMHYLFGVIDDYIKFNGEYSAVELKDTYEKAYALENYYLSNRSEYNRYFLEQWYSLIEQLYTEMHLDSLKEELFFAYLEEIESSTNLSIAIFDGELEEIVYPNVNHGQMVRMLPLIPAEILDDLSNADNVLYEDEREDTLYTTKIMKIGFDEYMMMTLKGDYLMSDFSEASTIENIRIAFQKNKRNKAYYIVNSLNEVILSSDETLSNRILDIKGHEGQNLMLYDQNNVRRSYRDTFYVNQKMYTDAGFYMLPLMDDNRLIFITDESSLTSNVNEITFMAILMTVVGVVLLYFIGSVMIYIVERYNLTAHRVANSNQVNRMIVVIFAVLILLNGMAIIQVNKVVFAKGYEVQALEALENYATVIVERENQFKEFVEIARKDAVVQLAFIYKGMALLDHDIFVPNHSIREIKSLEEVNSHDRDIEKSILEKGYFEYYRGPKLFRKDDFDVFYENYVIELQPGEQSHMLDRMMIFPKSAGEGYVVLTKSINKQLDLLYRLRDNFKIMCQPDDKEIFVSNITVFNDTGNTVISSGEHGKFDSRKLKDELTGYPMWYWYQFKHGELFRTVVKAIDGTYKESYSLVHYNDELEYYFVYNVPRKAIFRGIERLYNLYVSAIMFLLVGVFLTLGIKIRLNRKE